MDAGGAEGGAPGQPAAVVSGSQAVAVGDNNTVIVVKEGGQVLVGEQQVELRAVPRGSALARYLEHLIAHNRYLALQGIRSGGRLVSIELEQIYITLRATRQRSAQAEAGWLAAEAALAPGERRECPPQGSMNETVVVRVEEALAAQRRLVVLGDPGSGKTTLLRYLALVYAGAMAQGGAQVQEKLGLPEAGHLPILLPLRQIGAFLRAHRPADDGTEGCGLLLEFLHQHLRNERVPLPGDFFDEYLHSGRAVVLLDGLDEVADPALRGRVARLVESFSLAYPGCRYVVTSRVVGYSGAARLGAEYATTTVRDFSLEDVARFLGHWHRLVAAGQLGPGQAAEDEAARQTAQLMQAIRASERVRELAINPLMLTVIALVHRDRVKLPDRRAELYAEAVEVLLGKWDEARGVGEPAILDGQALDAGDKRLILQSLALHMHENGWKEIAAEDLRRFLAEVFAQMAPARAGIRRAVERFQRVIEERSGLLVARGQGVYAFSHLTFQEYLAALAVAGRDDYVEYTLARSHDDWWREVIRLEAGYLSTQSKPRTTRLIQALADKRGEPQMFHNLVLAAGCLQDAGAGRVEGNLQGQMQARLRRALEAPFPMQPAGRIEAGRAWPAPPIQQVIRRRSAAAQALAQVDGRPYWSGPYGEPDWVTIPAGEFWMGDDGGDDDEKPLHKVYLETFLMGRVPVTNAQYALFVRAAGYRAPGGWEDQRPPRGRESHPVVGVSWHDALAYCRWLGGVTGKAVTLPSEAQWEKAARGGQERRAYPWGDEFGVGRGNTEELGLGDTTPVGIFPEGASPYGVLDLCGNVWEWTCSKWEGYPYDPLDGREDLAGDDPRVVRGGSFIYDRWGARCAFRGTYDPVSRDDLSGFRAAVSPSP